LKLNLNNTGFNHSFYVFSREANINLSFGQEKAIPPGSLVSLIQRGLIYSHLENDWFLRLQKNNKNSIQNLMERRRKLFSSFKPQLLEVEKKLYISTQISNQKSILFCSWHPRKLRGYYSTRDSINYLSSNNGHLRSIETCIQDSIFDKNRKTTKSYEITSVEFNITGTLISTTSYSGLFNIWTETGVQLFSIFFIKRALIESRWSENSRVTVLAYLSGEIKIWSSWYSQSLLIILPNRCLLVSLEWKDLCCLVVFSKNKILSKLNLSKKKLSVIRAHNSQINDIKYSCEKEILGSCADDLLIKLWKPKKELDCLAIFRGHEKEVIVIVFIPLTYQKNTFPEKCLMVSGALDYSVRIWDINSKSCLKFFKLDGPVFSLEWDSNSRWVVVGVCGKVFALNLNTVVSEFKQIEGNYGIFSLNSHPMVNKYIGLSFKNIFLL